MKDSQKFKKKKKSKITAPKLVAESPSTTTPVPEQEKKSLHEFYQSAKKRFVLLVFIITVVNLVLGIGIIYLIGRIQENILGSSYTPLDVTSVPVLSSSINPNISAQSVIVIEKDSHTVVFDKNSSLRFAPASTTKIMTALVTLEYYPLDEYLSTSGVSTVEGSKMGLVEGEKMKVRDLLYGLLLPSGNDAAFVLAHNYPGGQRAFVKRMNEKAHELKLENTRFIDPAGLDDANYTTAFDLARLALFGLENPVFQKVVDTKQTIVYDQTHTHPYKLENLNELLNKTGVFGVKTGYTEEAGEVLVTSIKSKGKTFVIAVLKSEDRFADTEMIINQIINNIQLERL
jgi:D-alanyl-D-alanine carboxypeptidase